MRRPTRPARCAAARAARDRLLRLGRPLPSASSPTPSSTPSRPPGTRSRPPRPRPPDRDARPAAKDGDVDGDGKRRLGHAATADQLLTVELSSTGGPSRPVHARRPRPAPVARQRRRRPRRLRRGLPRDRPGRVDPFATPYRFDGTALRRAAARRRPRAARHRRQRHPRRRLPCAGGRLEVRGADSQDGDGVHRHTSTRYRLGAHELVLLSSTDQRRPSRATRRCEAVATPSRCGTGGGGRLA